ncbi:hypothetical protein LXA43DRAFT_896623 [Ganoderma leucocontextum]|nr:hypothetical protein LXA43DRAFT_896623 [Ganoderma leucocontextum]
MGGGRQITKKLKRVADVLGSKRVETKAQTTPIPSTPTKKDTRGWHWGTPRRPHAPVSPGQPSTAPSLPSLFSSLVAAISPRHKTATTRNALSQTDNPTLPSDFFFTHGADFEIPATHTPPHPANDDDSIASHLPEEGDPDDQDGVDGNYHHPSTRSHKFIQLGHAILARDLLDDREAPPTSESCEQCHHPVPTTTPSDSKPTFLYCDDCFPPRRKCLDCILQSHCEHPFHRIRAWDPTQRFWKPVQLGEIGYELALEHDGARCPGAPSQGRDFIVVHDHGIARLPIVYCNCPRAPDATSQLMRAGLWPATWEKPRSAITLQALKIFESLTVNAHTTAHDFIAHLERLSDIVAPDDVKDRVREFRIAVRTYNFVRACRRAGVEPRAELPVGCLAVLCPACPQPNHNMRPGWEERAQEYVDALHFCIDGNFHFNLKPKHTDPKDFPLTKGAAYFAHEDDFKTYIATTKPYPNEPSTCSQFVAMGAGKYKGPVSGIIALVCRHNLVLQGGIVDLTKGEKFLYVDFGYVSAMQRYRPLRMLIMMYDINCQYIKNLSRRLLDQFSDDKIKTFKSIQSADLPDCIVAGIGKYHAPMHTPECRPFFSLNNLPGVGDTFGENAEQKWADIEGISRATKEMAPGHRHDKLNDQNSDANAKLVHGMVDYLFEKHEVAVKRLADAEEYLKSVEESIADNALIATWRKEHDEWEVNVLNVKKHGSMDAPFEVGRQTSLTTQMIVAQLSQEHEKEGNRHGIALLDAMEAAFRLEDTRLDLLRKINASDGTAADCKKITAKVEHYRRDLRICSDEFEILLAPAVAKAIEDADALGARLPTTFPRRTASEDKEQKITPFTDKPPADEIAHVITKRKSESRAQKALHAMATELEESAILLPSSYHKLVRDHVGMKTALDTERKLREGLAAEALDKLRLHLTTHQALELRRKQVSGVINNTEVDRRLADKRFATDRAKYAYRKHRHLLRVLGMAENDSKFKPLRDQDCYAFAITAAEHRLGDSHRLPSWIWGDFSYITKVANGDIRNFLDDSLKAHWFKHSALVRRWREAVSTRREEMFRTLKSYRANNAQWLRRADELDDSGKGGAAAYARRQAFRYQRLVNKAQAKFPTIIHEVSSPCACASPCLSDPSARKQGVGMASTNSVEPTPTSRPQTEQSIVAYA